MGARGIRKRKGEHHLPKVDSRIGTPGDERRLFGQFRWGAYTPAGNFERFGFLTRQFSRGSRPSREDVGPLRSTLYALPVAAGFLILFAAILAIVAHFVT